MWVERGCHAYMEEGVGYLPSLGEVGGGGVAIPSALLEGREIANPSAIRSAEVGDL